MAKPEGKNAPVVLTIDVGGSHVKVLTSIGGKPLKTPSGPAMTAGEMVDAVKALAGDLAFDVISMGYPGPVHGNQLLLEPRNLGKGWVGFDFAGAFGKPTRIVNDAMMQAIGSYEGGRMLFLGLGTGLGAAMILEHVGQPMEVAHLPYRKEKTFEDYVGERGLEARGLKKWRESVFDVVARLKVALQAEYIVIGGGNVKKLKPLPPDCRPGNNSHAFEGGFRLWQGKFVVP
jgi:polyphosphate glucokinase